MANTKLQKIAPGALAWSNDDTFDSDMTADTLEKVTDSLKLNVVRFWEKEMM